MSEQFLCRNEDYGDDDGMSIEACDAEYAAREFAERYDSESCEYPDEQFVDVIRMRDGKKWRFRVCAYPRREYVAHEEQAIT